jgi:hypothetical protein
LSLEPLETRNLLTATSWLGLVNPVLAVEPNDAPGQAQDLGSLSQKPRAEVIGTISNSDGTDWYRFSLAQSARVKLATLDQLAGSPLVSDLALFTPDATDPSGYRLITQNDGALNGGDARISQLLTPGVYYVSVSSSSNTTGDYGLVLGTNQTLDLAYDLGNLTATGQGEAQGTIGNGFAGAADVNWYSFTLTGSASVTVTTPPSAGAPNLPSVLSLYNSDPFDFTDPFDLLGHRLLAQDVSVAGHVAEIDRQLAGGTYYVAVSGSGNRYFHPFLSGSGYPGATGDYDLRVTATDLGLSPTTNPVLLASDPVPNGVLDRSPLMLRVDFSAPLDPGSFNPGQGGNISLSWNPDRYGEGVDQDVPLGPVYFSPGANELQITPLAPLAPGFYTLYLGGDPITNFIPLADLSENPLGQDQTINFQVAGIEGNTGANPQPADTRATAHDLGDVTQAGIVQVAGAIGVDPTDPVPFNPAQVEVYHFHVNGTGRFAFTAEVFANRIGSPLDAGVSLFQDVGARQPPKLLAGNDNTFNPTQSDNGAYSPLYTDPVLYAGLTAGDYYLVVSSGGNVPDPFLDQQAGQNGIFDPDQSHRGSVGANIGPYVLNLFVQPFNELPPTVIATTPADGDTVPAPPTQIKVQFSEAVNLQLAAYLAFLQVKAGITPGQPQQGLVPPIYIAGADGKYYFPRLQSYDDTTHVATFLLLDRLPNGVNRFHLSGAQGITDFAGNALVGNDPGGDYVFSFTVNSPALDDPLSRTVQGDLSPDHPVDLGVLFPHELQTGVTVTRDAPSNLSNDVGGEEDYQFQVLQPQSYIFLLSGANFASGATAALTDAQGQAVPYGLQGGGSGLLAPNLAPGTYVLHLIRPAGSGYQLTIKLDVDHDAPVPLTNGPAPAIRLRLVAAPPDPTPSTPTTVTVRVPPAPSPGPAPVLPVANITPGPTTTVVDASPSAAAPPTSGSLNVPPDLLYTLGNGPVGGISGPTTGGGVITSTDRVVVRVPDRSLAFSVLQLTMLLQSGIPTDEEPQPLEPEASPGSRPPVEEGRVTGLSTSELLRDVGQVVDLFFEACGRLAPVAERDTAPSPNLDKSLFADAEKVDALLQARVSEDFEPAGGDDEGAIRPAAWRWLPALLLGGAGAAVALALNQRRRVGAWPLVGRRHEIE